MSVKQNRLIRRSPTHPETLEIIQSVWMKLFTATAIFPSRVFVLEIRLKSTCADQAPEASWHVGDLNILFTRLEPQREIQGKERSRSFKNKTPLLEKT